MGCRKNSNYEIAKTGELYDKATPTEMIFQHKYINPHTQKFYQKLQVILPKVFRFYQHQFVNRTNSLLNKHITYCLHIL